MQSQNKADGLGPQRDKKRRQFTVSLPVQSEIHAQKDENKAEIHKAVRYIRQFTVSLPVQSEIH